MLGSLDKEIADSLREPTGIKDLDYELDAIDESAEMEMYQLSLDEKKAIKKSGVNREESSAKEGLYAFKSFLIGMRYQVQLADAYARHLRVDDAIGEISKAKSLREKAVGIYSGERKRAIAGRIFEESYEAAIRKSSTVLKRILTRWKK